MITEQYIGAVTGTEYLPGFWSYVSAEATGADPPTVGPFSVEILSANARTRLRLKLSASESRLEKSKNSVTLP